MKPFMKYELRSVIANQWAAVHKKVDVMSNEEIMANDIEVLADNLYQEFFIEPVTIFEEDFSKRNIVQGKIKKYVDRFWGGYSQNGYIDVDGIIATFYFPYQGDENLFQCKASTYSLSGYPDISIGKKDISLRIERSLSEMNSSNAKDELLRGVERDIKQIRDGISYANGDVNTFNTSLRQKALHELEEKKKKVEAYFSIATMFEIPVEKKAYTETHIRLKRNIVPVAKQYEHSDYYGISDADYKDILTSIKHTASTYERTPASYRSLHEEDLRNTLLAALNATYKGDATGETFRNAGKTDICIERENRAAFVAECKMWTGQKEVAEAVKQLNSYLTWRNCKTALIYFVRRKDFLKILDTAKVALGNIKYIKNILIKMSLTAYFYHLLRVNKLKCE